MLVLFSLGSSQSVQGLLALRGKSMLGMVTRGGTIFFFFGCSRDVCLWVGLAHTSAQFQGPSALFLEYSLFLEGMKVKRMSKG